MMTTTADEKRRILEGLGYKQDKVEPTWFSRGSEFEGNLVDVVLDDFDDNSIAMRELLPILTPHVRAIHLPREANDLWGISFRYSIADGSTWIFGTTLAEALQRTVLALLDAGVPLQAVKGDG